MLILADHANGRWLEPDEYNMLVRKTFFPFAQGPGAFPPARAPDTAEHIYVGGFNASLIDVAPSGQTTVLYTHDITQALESVLAPRGGKLDLIAYDACLMGLIENAYALRNVAKVMVASEEILPLVGWDYTNWPAELIQRPSQDAEQVAAQMIRGFEKKNVQDGVRATLSATRLSKIDEATRALSNLAAQGAQGLAFSVPVNPISWLSARAQSLQYGELRIDSPYIDLDQFLGRFEALAVDSTLRRLATKSRNSLKEARIGAFASPALQGPYGSRGLSIYFPACLRAVTTEPSIKCYQPGGACDHPVDFVQGGGAHWADFLKAFLGLSSGSGEQCLFPNQCHCGLYTGGG